MINAKCRLSGTFEKHENLLVGFTCLNMDRAQGNHITTQCLTLVQTTWQTTFRQTWFLRTSYSGPDWHVHGRGHSHGSDNFFLSWSSRSSHKDILIQKAKDDPEFIQSKPLKSMVQEGQEVFCRGVKGQNAPSGKEKRTASTEMRAGSEHAHTHSKEFSTVQMLIQNSDAQPWKRIRSIWVTSLTGRIPNQVPGDWVSKSKAYQNLHS